MKKNASWWREPKALEVFFLGSWPFDSLDKSRLSRDSILVNDRTLT